MGIFEVAGGILIAFVAFGMFAQWVEDAQAAEQSRDRKAAAERDREHDRKWRARRDN